ncbi:hypothetical protein ACWGJ9_10500 [Curtobacterium citreum]
MSNPTRVKDVQGAGQVDPTTGKKVSGGRFYFGREAGAADISLSGGPADQAASQADLDALGEQLGGMTIPAGAYSNAAVTTMASFAKTYPNTADGAASVEEHDGVVSIDVYNGVARLRTDDSGNLRHAEYNDPDEEHAVRSGLLAERYPASTYRPYSSFTRDDFEAFDEYHQQFGSTVQDTGKDVVRRAGAGVIEVTTKDAGRDVIVTDEQMKSYLWGHVAKGRIQFPLAAEDRWVRYDGSPESEAAFDKYIDAIKDHPEILDGMAHFQSRGTVTANGKKAYVLHDGKWWS